MTDVKTPIDKQMAKVVERMTDLRQQKKDHVSAINEALKHEQSTLARYARAIKEGCRYVEDIDEPHNNC